MFSKISTPESTVNSSDQAARLAESIEKAEGIVVGAGAGLSASAGLT